MAEFENPYATKPGGARPIPGVLAEQYATMAEMVLKFFGVTLYQHEHEGLAQFMGAIIRAYPKLKPVDTGDGDK